MARTTHVAGAAGTRSKREEKFSYDYLNRLTEAKTYLSGSSTASRTLTFDYDPRGNPKTKTSDVSGDADVTDYAYPTTSDRFASATLNDATLDAVEYEFTHDTSGHIEEYDVCSDSAATCADEDDTFIAWNARGLATMVTLGSSANAAPPTARDSFYYGPDGSRYFRKSKWQAEEETEVEGETTTTTVTKTTRTYYAGAHEKTVTAGGATVERTRIGDSVIHVKTTPAATDTAATATSAFEYLHRDHLGSVEAVTDASGAELAVLGHDPYGERRDEDWTAQLTPTEVEELRAEHGERVSRGYTGHEHLDRTGLIHMNGRVYDPRLGRFLSPDPIVGDPTSSQSWNLYSYVRNNPVSYVDPTGLTLCDPRICNRGSSTPGGWLGGGSTTRTVTVTVTETVHGVMAVPYGYAVPVWTRVGGSAWPGGNDYVYDLTYDYFWGVGYQPYSYSRNVTRAVAFEDQSVADQPEDSEGVAGDWFKRWFLPGPHRYENESDPFCHGCKIEEVIGVLNRVGVHPNQEKPFVPGEKYVGDVDLPYFVGKDEVSVEAIYENGKQVGVRNTTLKNHELHPGIVERTIVRSGEGFVIKTIGTGTGPYGGPNVRLAKSEWDAVDKRVMEEAHRLLSGRGGG